MRPADAAALFDRNAGTYDAVNSVISLGLDRAWRRWVAEKAVRAPGDSVLDVMCGTGEVAIEAARKGADVVALDLSSGMLEEATRRAGRAGVAIETIAADVTRSENVPPGPYDGITMAFGIRYLDEPAVVLSSLAKHLGIAGRMVLLEFCVPPPGPVASAASFYFFRVLPRLAAALSGESELYEVLRDSTRRVGSADDLVAIARSSGLAVIERRTFGFGLVAGIVCVRDGSAGGSQPGPTR